MCIAGKVLLSFANTEIACLGLYANRWIQNTGELPRSFLLIASFMQREHRRPGRLTHRLHVMERGENGRRAAQGFCPVAYPGFIDLILNMIYEQNTTPVRNGSTQRMLRHLLIMSRGSFYRSCFANSISMSATVFDYFCSFEISKAHMSQRPGLSQGCSAQNNTPSATRAEDTG